MDHADVIPVQQEEYDQQVGDFDDNNETDKLLKQLELSDDIDAAKTSELSKVSLTGAVEEEQFLKNKKKQKHD